MIVQARAWLRLAETQMALRSEIDWRKLAFTLTG